MRKAHSIHCSVPALNRVSVPARADMLATAAILPFLTSSVYSTILS